MHDMIFRNGKSGGTKKIISCPLGGGGRCKRLKMGDVE
jgi:hypothetical protein